MNQKDQMDHVGKLDNNRLKKEGPYERVFFFIGKVSFLLIINIRPSEKEFVILN